MTTDDLKDCLPTGWRIEEKVNNGRRTKCYINVETGLKLYSKPAVIRHINNGNVNSESSELANKESKQCTKKKQIQLVAEDKSPDWLPDGWTVELRTVKSGRQYKCYVDPSTGSRFYSKPEVSRHLESTNFGASASNPKKKHAFLHKLNNGSTDPVSNQSDSALNVSTSDETCEENWCIAGTKKVKIEKTIDKELPSGWIKEIRIKKSGSKTRKDAFYYDSASDYVFRSKLEVLRYLETGEISRHAFKRKDKADNGEELIEDVIPRPSLAKQGRATRSSARKLHFEGEENPEGSTLSLRKPGGLKLSCSREPSGTVIPPQIGEEGSSAEEMTGMDSPIEENIDLDRLIFTITRDANLDGQARTLMESFPAAISNEQTVVAGCLAGSSPSGTQETEKGTLTEERVKPLPKSRDAGENQTAADTKDREPASPASEDVPVEKIFGDSKGGGDEKKPQGVVTDNCVGSEGQSGKRNTRKRKGLILPSRSSKRLAGVEVEPVTNTIPIERALRARSRKSCSETEANSPVALNSDELHQEKAQQVDVSVQTSAAPPVCGQAHPPEVEVSPNGNKDNKTPGEVPAALKHKSSNLEDSRNNENPKEVPAVLKQNSSSLENSRNDKKNPAEVSAALGQKSSNSEDSRNDKNPAEVSAAPEKKSSNLEDSPNDKKKPAEAYVAPEQRGFNLEDSPKGNKNPAEVSGTMEQKSSNLGINGGGSVPSASQFCLPPFWSDPCLEFAFKTLTGSMPVALDDNLESIKEYLQHQRRTSAANNSAAASNSNNLLPDTGMDSSPNNDASAAFVSLEKADSLQQSQIKPVSSHVADIGRNSIRPSSLGRK